jgi:UDPglucose 6-dehydrogenase
MVDVADADVHFLCVGTPQDQQGEAADLSHVWDAVDGLAAVAKPGSLVVGKSTVPVGTARLIQKRLDERRGPGVLAVVWNPEFLREGFAVADTLIPDRIVVGAFEPHSAAMQTMRDVYRFQIDSGVPFLETDVQTAELVKVAANAFLATKISFINAMAEICEKTSADVVDLADALGHDSRIGRKFLNAGIGFGGGCLPKDIRAFASRAEELGLGDSVDFLRWTDSVNLRQRSSVVDSVIQSFGDVPGDRRVTILGAAFKPNSDDVRDSPGLEIAAALDARGIQVRVHDPKALQKAAISRPDLNYCLDLSEALAGTDAVVLTTEWAEYSEISPMWAARIVRRPWILDGRNALDSSIWSRSGWTYCPMGRRRVAPTSTVMEQRSGDPEAPSSDSPALVAPMRRERTSADITRTGPSPN